MYRTVTEYVPYYTATSEHKLKLSCTVTRRRIVMTLFCVALRHFIFFFFFSIIYIKKNIDIL